MYIYIYMYGFIVGGIWEVNNFKKQVEWIHWEEQFEEQNHWCHSSLKSLQNCYLIASFVNPLIRASTGFIHVDENANGLSCQTQMVYESGIHWCFDVLLSTSILNWTSSNLFEKRWWIKSWVQVFIDVHCKYYGL